MRGVVITGSISNKDVRPPHLELLFRFGRTGKSGTYSARFLQPDNLLAPVLARAEQEGLITRTSPGEKVVGFTTAKGSTYELAGTATRRFKKVKNLQYGFSTATVYLTKEADLRLNNLIRSGGVPEMRNGELWVDFAKQRESGANREDEKVESSETPELGLYPFEELPRREGHRRWHIGHRIIKLDTGGYADFQLTQKGLSELRRLQQQAVD